MAHIEFDAQGARVRLTDHNGVRKTIRLSGVSKQNVKKVVTHIEALVTAKKTGLLLETATAVWLQTLEQELHDKLSKAGLVDRRKSQNLGDFIEQYIEAHSKIKDGTRTNLNLVRVNLVAYFGYERTLRSITRSDAEKFRAWLESDEGLGENTIRRRCGRARQFFTAAIRAKLITENPFEGMTVTVTGNKEKERFVTHEEAEKILAACPNAEWRLIFSLCRWGGLRCPSEILMLKWDDIVWDASRIIVTSPKTEHHQGHENRVIPLFPELLKPLLEVQEQAADGSVFAITRYRSSNQNLRTQFERIVRRAGILPWQKPFQNLRSTRETELMESYPSHVVCAWIGNSEAVARRHYLQTTDRNFDKAVSSSTVELLSRKPQGLAQGFATTANEGDSRKHGSIGTKKDEDFPSSSLVGALTPEQPLTRPGLEPGKSEPKSDVLPLHHRVTLPSAD